MGNKKSSLVLTGRVKGDPASKLDRIANEVVSGNNQMAKAIGTTNARLRALDNTASKFSSKTGQLLTGALHKIGSSAVSIAARGVREFGRAMAQAGEDATEFEEVVAEVSTLLDEGMDAQLQQMANASLRFANTFRSDARSQAKGFYTAVSAGADAGTDAIEIMTQANKLAVGGLASVEQSIDGLTTILNAYNLDAKFAGIVTNDLFVAMKKGKTTIPELVSKIGMLAPTANKVGISVEEMLSGVAAITTQGIQTDKAVISLNQALTQVLKPTADGAETARKLGIEFTTAAIRAQGLIPWLEEIAEKTRGDDVAITKLFGNVRALRAVLAATSEGGARKFSETLQEMQTNVTATDDAVERMSNTIAFQTDRLGNIIQSYGIMGATGVKEGANVVQAMRGVNDTLDTMFQKLQETTSGFETNAFAAETFGRSLTLDVAEGLADAIEGTGQLIGKFEGLINFWNELESLAGVGTFEIFGREINLNPFDASQTLFRDMQDLAEWAGVWSSETSKAAQWTKELANDIRDAADATRQDIINARGLFDVTAREEGVASAEKLRSLYDRMVELRREETQALTKQRSVADVRSKKERELERINTQLERMNQQAQRAGEALNRALGTSAFDPDASLSRAFGTEASLRGDPTQVGEDNAFTEAFQKARAEQARQRETREREQQLKREQAQEKHNRALERQRELQEQGIVAGKRYTATLVTGLAQAAIRGDSLGDALARIAEQLASRALQTFLFGLLSGGTFGGPGGGLFGILGFSKGGVVPGQGSQDSVPALLTPKERVLTVEENQAFERLLGVISGRGGVGGSAQSGTQNINATLNATVNSAGGLNDADIDRLIMDRIFPRWQRLMDSGALRVSGKLRG